MIKNMIKNKRKICSFALALTLAIPTIAYAQTYTDNISFGKMSADCSLTGTWSLTGYDKAKAKTTFTSSSTENTGYKVTAYLEAMKSDGGLMGSVAFDTGIQWAECNKSVKGVGSFNSTHTIANAKSVYNPVSYTLLSDW